MNHDSSENWEKFAYWGGIIYGVYNTLKVAVLSFLVIVTRDGSVPAQSNIGYGHTVRDAPFNNELFYYAGTNELYIFLYLFFCLFTIVLPVGIIFFRGSRYLLFTAFMATHATWHFIMSPSYRFVLHFGFALTLCTYGILYHREMQRDEPTHY